MKNRKLPFITAGALILTIGGIFSYLYMQNRVVFNWKTYNNTAYNYSIKYPASWHEYGGSTEWSVSIQKKQKKADIPSSPSDSSFQIQIRTLKTTDTLDSEVQKMESIASTAGISYEKTATIIGGEKAYKLVSKCNGVNCGLPQWIMIKKFGDHEINEYNFIANQAYLPVYDSILSTFKFVE